MAATVGHGHFVEFAVEQECTQSALSSRAAAIDADPSQIEIRVLGSESLNPGDAIGQTGVSQILTADVMECLGAIGGSHSIDLYNDETQFGQRLLAVIGRKPLRHKRVLRAGVNVLDHRVTALWIKRGGTPDDTVDVGAIVPALGHEPFGNLPASGQQGGHVGAFQFADQRSVCAAPQFHDRGQVDPGISVD